MIGQSSEVEPVYDRYSLGFFPFDPAARRAYFGVPPAVLRFYTVRSRASGWFWPEVDASLRNLRFMACYHGVQSGMHAMFRFEAPYCTP